LPAAAIATTALGIAAGGSSAAQVAPERLQQCENCHGEGGNSRIEKIPSLAGQPELFLTNQLILFRDKLRRSEAMEPFVRGLKDGEIAALAAHYTKLPSKPSNEPVDAALVAKGAKVASGHFCSSCHLPDYSGREQMPRLAHQRIDYLIDTMIAYREGRRSGIDTSMNSVMYQVPDADILALAHYLASIR
jgi:cytochrome c553